LGVYRREAAGEPFMAWAVWVLTMDGDAIAEVTAFLDARLVPAFGLPEQVVGR
jgi:ketosteroid isomerase-like protein